MRYPRSGHNAQIIYAATAVSTGGAGAGIVPCLLGAGGITSGRVFWLRGVSIMSHASNLPLLFLDQASGATATTLVSLALNKPVDASGAVLALSTFNFSPPGVKFATGISGMLAATGTMPIGHVNVWGYEE